MFKISRGFGHVCGAWAAYGTCLGSMNSFSHFQRNMFPFTIWSCDGSEIHHKGISITLFLLWLSTQLDESPQTKLIKNSDQENQTRSQKIKLYLLQGSLYISISRLLFRCDHPGNSRLQLLWTKHKQIYSVWRITSVPIVSCMNCFALTSSMDPRWQIRFFSLCVQLHL